MKTFYFLLFLIKEYNENENSIQLNTMKIEFFFQQFASAQIIENLQMILKVIKS